MKEAIAKAGALIEAMEYIRQFRGRIVVVKLGGSVLDDTALQKKAADRYRLYGYRRDAAGHRPRRRKGHYKSDEQSWHRSRMGAGPAIYR